MDTFFLAALVCFIFYCAVMAVIYLFDRILNHHSEVRRLRHTLGKEARTAGGYNVAVKYYSQSADDKYHFQVQYEDAAWQAHTHYVWIARDGRAKAKGMLHWDRPLIVPPAALTPPTLDLPVARFGDMEALIEQLKAEQKV